MAAFAVAILATGLTGDPRYEKWLFIHIIAGAGLCLWPWLRLRFDSLHILALAFLFWASLSLLWTPDIKEGAIDLRDTAALLLCGWWLGQQRTEWIEKAFGLTLIGAIVMWFAWPQGGFANVNFAAETFILLIPWVCRKWGIVLALIAIAVVATMEPNLRWVALGASLVAFSLYWGVRAALYTSAAGAAIFAVMAVFVVDVRASLGTRLEFWFNSFVMWLDRPFLGTGVGGFNYLYPLYQERHTWFYRPDDFGKPYDTMLHPITMYAGFPHNEILSVLVTYGLVGFAIVLLGCLCLANRVTDHRALWTLWLGFALSMVGFPLHNPSTGLILAVSAGVCCCGWPRWRLLDSLFLPAGSLQFRGTS